MFIAINKFQVISGKEQEFQDAWASRNTYLKDVSGFLSFKLLRGEDGVFLSHSTWQDKESFVAWVDSEAFKQAHARGGSKGLLKGPPEFSGYDVVLEQSA